MASHASVSVSTKTKVGQRPKRGLAGAFKSLPWAVTTTFIELFSCGHG
jgi:hypothetical protein